MPSKGHLCDPLAGDRASQEHPFFEPLLGGCLREGMGGRRGRRGKEGERRTSLIPLLPPKCIFPPPPDLARTPPSRGHPPKSGSKEWMFLTCAIPRQGITQVPFRWHKSDVQIHTFCSPLALCDADLRDPPAGDHTSGQLWPVMASHGDFHLVLGYAWLRP